MRFVYLFLLFLGFILYGHHAMEYIEMESYSTARAGESVFHLHYDYFVDDVGNSDLDHWEFTPGFSYGITNRLMFDIHTHFAKFNKGHLVPSYVDSFGELGPSPFIEAFAFSLQYRLTESHQFPIDIAMVFTYEYPMKRSKELLDGQMVYEGTLIISRDFGAHSNICLNFNFGKEKDEIIKSSALGIKTPISQDPHGIALGLEFLVEDITDILNTYSFMPGVYAPFSEDIVFKTGIEIGKGMDSMRANATMMYRF